MNWWGGFIPFARYLLRCASGTIPEFQQHGLLRAGGRIRTHNLLFRSQWICLGQLSTTMYAGVHTRRCFLVYVPSVALEWSRDSPLWLSKAKKGHSSLEEWPLQLPLNSGFVWEPAGGFEPSTCCVRNTHSPLTHCHLFTDGDQFSRRSLHRLSPTGYRWIHQLWSKLWSRFGHATMGPEYGVAILWHLSVITGDLTIVAGRASEAS